MLRFLEFTLKNHDITWEMSKMKLVFDFNGELVVDWWMITKTWSSGTEDKPIEHRTMWWLQDYDEAMQLFIELESSLGLERQRTWSKRGRIVFIVSKTEDSDAPWEPLHKQRNIKGDE